MAFRLCKFWWCRRPGRFPWCVLAPIPFGRRLGEPSFLVWYCCLLPWKLESVGIWSRFWLGLLTNLFVNRGLSCSKFAVFLVHIRSESLRRRGSSGPCSFDKCRLAQNPLLTFVHGLIESTNVQLADVLECYSILFALLKLLQTPFSHSFHAQLLFFSIAHETPTILVVLVLHLLYSLRIYGHRYPGSDLALPISSAAPWSLNSFQMAISSLNCAIAVKPISCPLFPSSLFWSQVTIQ